MGAIQAYRVVIVEDSPDEAEALRSHLERYADENHVRFSIQTMRSALEFITQSPKADLIFMDIDLPGFTGMELAELLRTYDKETPLIFVTNLAQYALNGYKVGALDYLVKPVSYTSLSTVMNRALAQLGRKRSESITVTCGESIRVVPIADISFIDVKNHYLSYHLLDHRSLVSRGTLTSLEKRLANSGFVRISKSCLVNMVNVKVVTTEALTLKNDEIVYISRSKRKEALRLIADYLGGSL